MPNDNDSEQSETTTVGVKRTTHSVLVDLKNRLRAADFDEVINRLIRGTMDVFVEFVLVDNELPLTHTVVFQLGEDKDSLYLYDAGKITPITIEEVQRLLKKTKKYAPITNDDIKIIYHALAGGVRTPAMEILRKKSAIHFPEG